MFNRIFPTSPLKSVAKLILEFQIIFLSIKVPDDNSKSTLNPLTLGVPLDAIVCFFHTFDNNLRNKVKVHKLFERKLLFGC